jgi:hypothetical protein
VKEFIHMLVAAQGSITSPAFGPADIDMYRLAQLGHVSPMIGTLLIAHDVEKKPLKLYRFEAFESQWKKMVNDSKFDVMSMAMNITPSHSHPSSSDAYSQPKKAAKMLLYGDSTGNASVGYYYLRVVCRLYLVDFVCAGYKLPVACEDLAEELVEIADRFEDEISQ